MPVKNIPIRLESVHRSPHVGQPAVSLDFRLSDADSAKFSFKPGQYIIIDSGLAKPGEPGKSLKRAYTICSAPHELPRLRLAIKALDQGKVSEHLQSLAPGSQLSFSGPYGKFTLDEDAQAYRAGLCVVATDSGMSAATALLQRPDLVEKQKLKPKLIWLASSDQYMQDLDYWCRHLPTCCDLTFLPIPSPAQRQSETLDLQALTKNLDDATNGYLYLVGDGRVVEVIRKYVNGRGMLAERIRCEYFFNKPKPDDGPKKGLREGFTTGACAAAAAKGAAEALLKGSPQSSVCSILPMGRQVRFALERCELLGDQAVCSIRKDGGDDPDCTHGAEIIATVKLITDNNQIQIEGGAGVARVTKPGLGLTVGEAAINPVPRQNITDMIRQVIEDSPYQGAEVTISVPDGEERAKQTLNARLGLLGGISILGTTGIVKPYSTSAFIASVAQAIQLAHADGCHELVFTTGGRSEAFAMSLRPELSESAFIQVGDYIGIALRHSVRQAMISIHIVGMMGKLSKMADGRMMTHAAHSEVNMKLLAQLVGEAGGSLELCQEVSKANTARHVMELCREHGVHRFADLICQAVASHCTKFAKKQLQVKVTMVDFSGDVLGSYPFALSA